MNNDEKVISSLEMEYVAMRQEIRDQVAAIDRNLSSSIAIMGGLAALAGLSKREEVIYILPSIIFMFTAIHFVRQASIEGLGMYCQAIEAQLRTVISDERVLLDWEAGKIRSNRVTSPKAAPQLASYMFFSPLVGAFAVISWFAYRWNEWTLIIHLAEVAAIIILVFMHLRAFSQPRRDKAVRQYLDDLRAVRGVEPSHLAKGHAQVTPMLGQDTQAQSSLSSGSTEPVRTAKPSQPAKQALTSSG